MDWKQGLFFVTFYIIIGTVIAHTMKNKEFKDMGNAFAYSLAVLVWPFTVLLVYIVIVLEYIDKNSSKVSCKCSDK